MDQVLNLFWGGLNMLLTTALSENKWRKAALHFSAIFRGNDDKEKIKRGPVRWQIGDQVQKQAFKKQVQAVYCSPPVNKFTIILFRK